MSIHHVNYLARQARLAREADAARAAARQRRLDYYADRAARQAGAAAQFAASLVARAGTGRITWDAAYDSLGFARDAARHARAARDAADRGDAGSAKDWARHTQEAYAAARRAGGISADPDEIILLDAPAARV